MVILIIIWAVTGAGYFVVHLAGDRLGPRAGDDGEDRIALGWASAAAVAPPRVEQLTEEGSGMLRAGGGHAPGS